MKRNRRRIWKKQGGYWFCYLGKHRWFSPQAKGKVWYYKKKTGSFYSPATKNSGGLKGLKYWWKKRSKTKGYKFHGVSKKYHNKGHFDYLSYLRSQGR